MLNRTAAQGCGTISNDLRAFGKLVERVLQTIQTRGPDARRHGPCPGFQMRIMFVCWREHRSYEENSYLTALERCRARLLSCRSQCGSLSAMRLKESFSKSCDEPLKMIAKRPQYVPSFSAWLTQRVEIKFGRRD